MSSWFPSLNPLQSFPEYQGLYDVGTVDVEIPTADIPAVSDAPEGAQPTISFRLFYPCVKPAKDDQDRPVRWIPQPQRITIASTMKYLGMNERIAGALSYLPRQLYWIRLPAFRNATLLEPPTRTSRWPVTFFSHGLAGSRNAYSQICGDLASNGMIVVALDHRDGSSPIQYVRGTANSPAHVVHPTHIPHSPLTDEIHEARDAQLRVRLWEMCLAYEALIKIDSGHNVENLDSNTSGNSKERTEVLKQFNDRLDVYTPGKVTWSGHSFGAATAVQLLKSIFYYQDRTKEDGKPLIVPSADAAIVQQVAPESPALLLDMWCTPLKSPFQRFLWDRPLPSYAVSGPDGANVLSVLSESFQNWKDNLNSNKIVIARPSPSRRPSAAPVMARETSKPLPAVARLRAQSPELDSGYASSESSSQVASGLKAQSSRGSGSHFGAAEKRSSGPHMFYVGKSQHFNQSDYGIIFPWLAQKFTKAEEPERCLALNTRAMVQVLREADIELAGEGDPDILSKKDDMVRRWVPINVVDDDEKSVSSPRGLDALDRKLSVGTESQHLQREDTNGSLRSPKAQAQMKRETRAAELSPTGSLTMGAKTDAQLQELQLPTPAESP